MVQDYGPDYLVSSGQTLTLDLSLQRLGRKDPASRTTGSISPSRTNGFNPNFHFASPC